MRNLTEYSFVTTILVFLTNTDFPQQRVTMTSNPQYKMMTLGRCGYKKNDQFLGSVIKSWWNRWV